MRLVGVFEAESGSYHCQDNHRPDSNEDRTKDNGRQVQIVRVLPSFIVFVVHLGQISGSEGLGDGKNSWLSVGI